MLCLVAPSTWSARKRRNHLLCCWCTGYHFPHRIGSRASRDYARRMGTVGCIHACPF